MIPDLDLLDLPEVPSQSDSVSSSSSSLASSSSSNPLPLLNQIGRKTRRIAVDNDDESDSEQTRWIVCNLSKLLKCKLFVQDSESNSSWWVKGNSAFLIKFFILIFFVCFQTDHETQAQQEESEEQQADYNRFDKESLEVKT